MNNSDVHNLSQDTPKNKGETLKLILANYAELLHNGQLQQMLFEYASGGWFLFPVCWFICHGWICSKGHRQTEVKVK